jgi:4-amino-4-deoxy-L-arabinose transferase-like glycosyltransferase
VTPEDRASSRARRRQALWLFGLSLGLRLVVVAFAARRFPPADDGGFYHTVAARIAAGAGYTWAWPDGAVTYAAHYPVGYPALMGAAYWLFGVAPWVAMLLNALLGALLVVGVHQVALSFASLARARLAALAVALHPTLLLYTAALMTEAAAASLLVLLAAAALWIRSTSRASWWRPLLGLFGAGLVLIRPQLLPVLAALGAVAVWLPAGASSSRALLLRLRGALEVLAIAVACCLPWTLRNCAKMDGCVFVSANGGWNLLIGTLPEGKGSFAPIAGETVPVECREVFGEAGKDRCFGQAGARRIREAPGRWLLLVPQKLGQLFDHGAIASSYLHTSNPGIVSERVKLAIAAIETLYSRLLLLAATLGLLRSAGRRVERLLALAAAVFTLSPWGFLAQIALLSALLAGATWGWPWENAPLRDAGHRQDAGPLRFLAASLLALCLVTHMVFFGAARYALVWLPWLAWLMVLPGRPPRLDTSNAWPARVF